jgi:hypothetical protein
MVGVLTHVFSATQAEQTSNSLGAATTWVGPNEWNSAHAQALTLTGNTAGSSSFSATNIPIGGTNNITVSVDSNSVLWISGPTLTQYASGITITGNSAGTSSLAAAALTISGGSNISISGAANALTFNGATSLAETLYLSGNSAGSSSLTMPWNYTFAGTQNLTVSVDSNSKIWFEGPSLTPYDSAWTITGNSSGTSSIAANALTLNASNNITISASAGGVTISGPTLTQFDSAWTVTGNTQGTSSLVVNALTISVTQNLTASAAANGLTIKGPQLSAWPLGFSVATATSMEPPPAYLAGRQFILPTELAMSRIDLYGSASLSATTATVATTAAASASGVASGTGTTNIMVGLYSRGIGTSTGTLYTVASASMLMSASWSLSSSVTGSTFALSQTLSVTWSTGVPFGSSTTTYSGSTSANASSNQATMLTAGNTSQWNGVFVLPMPVGATTIEPGEYYVGAMLTNNHGAYGPQISFLYDTGFMPGAGVPTYFGIGTTVASVNQIAFLYMQGARITSGLSSNGIPSPTTISNMDQTTQSVWRPICVLNNFGTNATVL